MAKLILTIALGILLSCCASSIATSPGPRVMPAIETIRLGIDPSQIPHTPIIYLGHTRSFFRDAAPASDTPVAPPRTRSMRAEYSAAPHTLSKEDYFQSRLQAFKHEWQGTGKRREAYPTSLPTGRYIFGVKTMNEGSVESTGASYWFVIRPAFTQTLAFALACGGAVVLLLWLLFRLRIRALNERARLATAQRHAERERIARDLHDTLLQGIQALLFRLDRWSREDGLPERLREEIAAVAEQSRAIVIDGRDRIVMLRQHKGEPSEIVQALDDFTRQAALPGKATLDLRRHGVARRISPHAYEHILNIACEAIRNACAHAQATRIEVDVRYCPKSLQVEVKDNGRGIPANILSCRHERHFGILGMYERAIELRAQLTHETADGTRVVLCVHGSRAYADYQRGMLESLQLRLAWLRQSVSSGHPRGG